VPTQCVINNLLDAGCTSQFYQYDAVDGALVTDNSGSPVPQNPAVPLGLTITPTQSLNTILGNLVSAQNCVLTPNFIAGMLQVIQANPAHPVSQIFCNLVCSCQPCEEVCDPNLTVDQVVFNPIQQTSVDFTFYAQANTTYDFEFVNTSSLIPIVTTYVGYTPTVSNANTTVDTATLPGFDPLVAGATYQLFITANSTTGGFSCPNGSWYFTTPADPSCDCENVLISITQESAATDYVDVDIIYLVAPGQTVPIQYQITLNDTSGPLPGFPLYITVATGTTTTNFVYPDPGTLPPDTYTLEVVPVCSLTPIVCLGDPQELEIELTGTIICDPPTITGVTIVP
jgi:hypothetical protein